MTSQVPLRELSTVELYALWEAELCQMVRPPNIALVAACEVHAESRGVDLKDVVSLLGRGRWNAALHPRGKDGKFIEVGGLIRLFKGLGGKEQRGQVTDIIPGKSSDGHDAKIRVSLFDEKGNDTGKIIDASPNEIMQAPVKARLDGGDVPEAPGGGGSEPLKAIKTDDMGGTVPFASQFAPAAREARAAGNTEQVAAFEELDPIVNNADVDPPEIRPAIVAKRDEWAANGEAEKVAVADFTLEAWDNEYEGWESPVPAQPSRPATKEESDAAMNEISSRMLREAGRDTTNFNLADVFTGPGEEESSPSMNLVDEASLTPDQRRRLQAIRDEDRDARAEGIPGNEPVPEAPGGEESDAQLDLMGVSLGNGPNTTLAPEEIEALAKAVESGQPIDVKPPDIDDVVDFFADNDGPTDLTLVPPFSEMRGKGGRLREDMPQIPPEQTDAFNERLRAAGISVEPITVDPYALKASQSELDGTKTGGIMRAAKAGKLDLLGNPLWVSADGYVFDGHHRWAAASVLAANCIDPQTGTKKRGNGCPVEIPVVQVGMPISELLVFGDQFNAEAGIEKLGFGEDRASDAGRFVENVPAAPAAPMIPAAGLAAAGEEGDEPVAKPPEPDENGNFKMATDAEDFETLGMEWDSEGWAAIEQPESDGEFPPNPNFPANGTQASLRTASLRARVHGTR